MLDYLSNLINKYVVNIDYEINLMSYSIMKSKFRYHMPVLKKCYDTYISESRKSDDFFCHDMKHNRINNYLPLPCR